MTVRLATALAASIAASAANANTPADYAWTFAIDTPATSGPTSAWRVELTPAAYAWVQDAGLRDIEAFNANGRPLPLARYTTAAPATARERTAALPVLGLPASMPSGTGGDLHLRIERDTAGHLRRIDAGEQAAAKPAVRDWLLDASGFDHAIDRLVLTWSAPASGVVARFGIEASDDLQGWRGAGSGTVLALEQDGAHLERRDIELRGVRAKYLRLHRIDDGIELADLGVTARAFERDAAPRSWLDAAIVATGPGPAPLPGVTRYDYALPSALPVEAARIELANDNSLAWLALLDRDPGNPAAGWRERARVTAFRLRSGAETLRNAEVELAGTSRLREFRIESHTPLAAAPRLSLGYRPDTLVFLAEGDAPYTLAVGSRRAQRPDYPVDAALASLRAGLGKDWQPPLARLGAATRSAGDTALTPLPAAIPWRRWLLWGVLVVAAAVVGGLALGLLRGAQREPPPR